MPQIRKDSIVKHHLDLHMHSSVSLDADFSPAHLMAMCAKAGLDVVALCDHNAARGIGEAKTAASTLGFSVIPAIEIDAVLDGTDLHILGYGIDERAPVFHEIEARAVAQERDASRRLIELVRALGIVVPEKEVWALAKNGVVNAEMIAEAALKDERNRGNELLKPYFPGGERNDNPFVNFYWDYATRGKPAYVPMEFIPLEEAVKIITDTGGFAVLAHPHTLVGRDEDMLEKIFLSGVKGLEVYCSYHDAEATRFYREIAEKYGVIKTMGSDFHGKNKPAIRLGSVGCDEQDELYERIAQEIRQNPSLI